MANYVLQDTYLGLFSLMHHKKQTIFTAKLNSMFIAISRATLILLVLNAFGNFLPVGLLKQYI